MALGALDESRAPPRPESIRMKASGAQKIAQDILRCDAGIQGLMEYDAKKGIDWEWQLMDGAMTKTPLGEKDWPKSNR